MLFVFHYTAFSFQAPAVTKKSYLPFKDTKGDVKISSLRNRKFISP